MSLQGEPFIRKMRELRAQGRHFVFLDETWLNQGYTRTCSWQDSAALKNPEKSRRDGLSVGAVKRPSGSGKRIMVVHAGSVDGFIPGAFLFFRAVEHDGDYHRNMDAPTFERWFTEQLLPNIPEASIIIMDNASYHSRRGESFPLSTWKKNDLKLWLISRGYKVKEDVLRSELWEMAKEARKLYDSFYCDSVAKQAGHTVVRLPPYHSHFNPIELIWAQLKGHVAKFNKSFKIGRGH